MIAKKRETTRRKLHAVRSLTAEADPRNFHGTKNEGKRESFHDEPN